MRTTTMTTLQGLRQEAVEGYHLHRLAPVIRAAWPEHRALGGRPPRDQVTPGPRHDRGLPHPAQIQVWLVLLPQCPSPQRALLPGQPRLRQRPQLLELRQR